MMPGPQFQQLDMFKPAHELTTRKYTEPGDLLPGEHVRNLWAHKKRESDDEGLTADIKEHGVATPVDLFHDGLGSGRQGQPQLMNGHHRSAVARSLGKNYLVPVKHSDVEQLKYNQRARRGKLAAQGEAAPHPFFPTRSQR